MIVVRHVIQKGLVIYPEVDPDKTYRVNQGERISGRQLREDGYFAQLPLFPNATITQIVFTAED